MMKMEKNNFYAIVIVCLNCMLSDVKLMGWASGVRMLTSICASTTISEKKVI